MRMFLFVLVGLSSVVALSGCTKCSQDKPELPNPAAMVSEAPPDVGAQAPGDMPSAEEQPPMPMDDDGAENPDKTEGQAK